MHGAATKPLLAILIVIAGGSLAFGQAGSVGGVVGKTDKSVSGGGAASETQEQPTPRSRAQRPIDKRSSDQASEGSLSGRWRWSAACTLGHYEGEFDLAQTSHGNFNGSFSGAGGAGPITDGHISGSSVSFTQTSVSHYWKGQLTAGRMSGTISGSGIHYAKCSWEAARK